MDGYLVMVRGRSDDVPVRLFADREAAVSYARSLTLERARALTAEWLDDDDNGDHIDVDMVAVVRFEGGRRLEHFIANDYLAEVLERDYPELPSPSSGEGEEWKEGLGPIGEGS